MAPQAHAKLSPSSSARWSTCTASVEAVIQFHKEYPESVIGETINAREGTAAHAACEDYLLDKIPERPEWITDDKMWDDILYHGLAFREYVRDLLENEKDLILIEKRLHMDNIDDDMYGTGDVVIYNRRTKTVQIVDYKYGYSYVSAYENTQLMLYGVGAFNLMQDMGFEVREIVCHIYQPRVPGGVTTYTFDIAEMWGFVATMCDAVEQIGCGATVFMPSEKACQWCDAAPKCQAHGEWLADKALGQMPMLDAVKNENGEGSLVQNNKVEFYTDEQLVEMFNTFEAMKRWQERVIKHLEREVEKGNLEDHLKFVAGRGSNVCIDTDAVELTVGDEAYHPPAKPKLKSKTDLERVVGKKNFDRVLGRFFKKVPGKPKLVKASAAGEPIKTAKDTIADMPDES